AGLFGMVVIVEADADELADTRDRHAVALLAGYRRQAGGIDLPQTVKCRRRELVRRDIREHAAEIAHVTIAIEHARLFLTLRAIAKQFHNLVLLLHPLPKV